jgi:predicted nuclease of predicted toxin-antitoxin system
MRLLFDEHVSARKIGRCLRDAGHDVRAIAEEAELVGLDDPDVLALAARDDRVLITFNHRDFAPLLREWAESGRHHAGCILVFGIDHSEIGLILRGLNRLLVERDEPAAWRNITEAVTRARAST